MMLRRLPAHFHVATNGTADSSASHLSVVLFLGAALLLIAAFFLRIDNLATLPIAQSSDEAEIMVDGFQIAHAGAYPLYEDFGHPDPLFQLVMAGSAAFFGPYNFTFRLTTVFVGTLTIAAACWAARQCLPGLSKERRWLIGLGAAAVLAVNISHLTLSRSVYRGILQPLFILFYIGFLLRGLRASRRTDGICAGVCLGLAMYTYTAAFATPASILIVAVSLLAFAHRFRRAWLPIVLALSISFAIVAAPFMWRLATHPQSVLGRAQDVSANVPSSLVNRVGRLLEQFFIKGDSNPQYNSGSAPLLPPVFDLFFIAGLLWLIWHWREPSTVLLLTLLILEAVPVLATDEIPHGLRISGEFTVFPLVIAIGVNFVLVGLRLLQFASQRTTVVRGTMALAALFVFAAISTRQDYLEAWSVLQNETVQVTPDLQMKTSDWYFRPDRREFADWIVAQKTPLLLPVDEVALALTRSWLMTSYPEVITADDTFRIPANTQLVIPWSLEGRSLRSQTRHFVLLADHKIILLPPFSEETYSVLLQSIDTANTIERTDGSLLARVIVIPEGTPLTYEHRSQTNVSAPVFDEAVRLDGWRGPDTLPPNAPSETLLYTLDWQALTRNDHYYRAFLQLQTQDYNRLAGDDVIIWRWLFPGMLWKPNDVIPDKHVLQIPANLAPGAYRLVAGLYLFLGEPLSAKTDEGQPLAYPVTIGWLKVPHPASTVVPPSATPVNALFAGTFMLTHVQAAPEQGKFHLHLYWKSLARRPGIDATIFVHIVDANGKLIAQQDARPEGGSYPTFIWDKDEVIETEYWLETNAIDPAQLTLQVGMYTFPGAQRVSASLNATVLPDGLLQLDSLRDLMR